MLDTILGGSKFHVSVWLGKSQLFPNICRVPDLYELVVIITWTSSVAIDLPFYPLIVFLTG